MNEAWVVRRVQNITGAKFSFLVNKLSVSTSSAMGEASLAFTLLPVALNKAKLTISAWTSAAPASVGEIAATNRRNCHVNARIWGVNLKPPGFRFFVLTWPVRNRRLPGRRLGDRRLAEVFSSSGRRWALVYLCEGAWRVRAIVSVQSLAVWIDVFRPLRMTKNCCKQQTGLRQLCFIWMIKNCASTSLPILFNDLRQSRCVDSDYSLL